jgi:hypothetical protein
MGHDDLVIIGRVAGALVIGALIGFERTFHGRPAGFRTHSLVCIASAILMIVTVYQNQWMTLLEHDAIRTDPTRMAQGIMTGIGFLGDPSEEMPRLGFCSSGSAAPYWIPRPLIARSDICAGSFTPVWPISIIFLAIISVTAVHLKADVSAAPVGDPHCSAG